MLITMITSRISSTTVAILSCLAWLNFIVPIHLLSSGKYRQCETSPHNGLLKHPKEFWTYRELLHVVHIAKCLALSNPVPVQVDVQSYIQPRVCDLLCR